MKFGLEQHIIDKLIAVFEQYPKVDKALVFGSRAKGNYRPDSDIDIAIKGQDLSTDDIIAISVAFEEKGITHKIDLINYHTIKEPELKGHIDRVGIEFYSRWKECRLGDYIETINGFAFKSTDFLDSEKPNSLPIIKIKNVANGDVNIDGVHHHLYSENLKKYVVEKGNILISLTGNHPELETQVVGLVSKYKLEKKALLNQRVGKLFSKKPLELNDDYLYYYLKNKDTHQYLASQSSGSANQANISKTDIEKISFSKPPIQEQTAIATILSSLDDKIDLLNRQNKTLEQLAETLFRQWFVEEAEESWEVKSFGDLVETTLGGEWGKENIEGEFTLQVQCIRGTDIADLRKGIPDKTPIRFIKQKKFESIEIKDGDLIMEISGGTDNQSTGRTVYINSDIKALFKYPLVFSNFCRLIRPKKSEYSFFLYAYINHLYEQGDLFNLENGSSGIKNLNYKALLFELEYKMPNEKRIIQFHKEVERYFYKINKNKFQIRTLTQTRDTLLPKLMSGEVRVKI